MMMGRTGNGVLASGLLALAAAFMIGVSMMQALLQMVGRAAEAAYSWRGLAIQRREEYRRLCESGI